MYFDFGSTDFDHLFLTKEKTFNKILRKKYSYTFRFSAFCDYFYRITPSRIVICGEDFPSSSKSERDTTLIDVSFSVPV